MTNQVEAILHRAPVRVNFAGLLGDTYKMRNHGWELNVHQHYEHSYDAMTVSFSGYHRGYGLKMFTNNLLLSMRMLAGGIQSILNEINGAEFEVVVKTSSEHISIAGPPQMTTIAKDWSGVIDFKPMDYSRKSFEEHFEFPVHGKALVVPDNKLWTVQEHLDAIRSIQQPSQDEILRGLINEKRQTKDILKLVAC